VDYFGELGYTYIHGPVIAPDGEAPERTGYKTDIPSLFVINEALTRRYRDRHRNRG